MEKHREEPLSGGVAEEPDRHTPGPGCGSPGPATRAIHGGAWTDHRMKSQPKTMPIYETSVFVYEGLDQADDFLAGDRDSYMYTRLGNPNQRALEEWATAMEGSEDSTVAASGMAALFGALAALAPGVQVALARDCYGGTLSLVRRELGALGIASHLVDTQALAEGREVLPPGTTVLVVETLSNPRLGLADIPALAALSHGAGARLLVDNSFLSPLLFRPLEHGADGVIHSTTKYINGHSDAGGGIFSAGGQWVADARRVIQTTGGSLSPFEAWLTLRGARTLELRMTRHSQSALRVARWLESCPGVSQVSYPGLESHPGHRRALELLPSGMGGMLAFDLPGGLKEADCFIRGLDLVGFAPSLAGVMSTLSHPLKTSHRGLDSQTLKTLGIGEGTIRLSVGLEDPADICADLARGLAALDQSRPHDKEHNHV